MLMCEGIDANACCKLYKRKLFEGVRYPACAYEVVPVTYKVFLKANRVANIKEYGYYIEKDKGLLQDLLLEKIIYCILHWQRIWLQI